jgi:beta-glucosidase
VLTGAVSPSGRTAVTWPRSTGQLPLYYGERPSGRPASGPPNRFTSRYLDVPNEPLFTFGHGLTYGRFALSNLAVSPASVGPADTLEARVDVVNEGERTACETVFLFTHDPVASVARPVLELKAVSHITLSPGERGTVTLTVPASALRFLGPELTPVFEPGELQILVGPRAERAALLGHTVRLLKV